MGRSRYGLHVFYDSPRCGDGIFHEKTVDRADAAHFSRLCRRSNDRGIGLEPAHPGDRGDRTGRGRRVASGVGWLPASGGFVLGILLMLLLDGLLPHLHNGAARAEGLPSSFRRTTLLVLAVTLHNIPEGMAVGLSFARAAQHGGSRGLVAAAGALALGIGIQNFPEGAAVALPLHQEGLSRMKSFVYGALSGIVEPLFGVAVVLVSAQLTPFMPWLLSAAAGAMLYVVVEELIPEAHLGEHSHSGTLGVMAGFLVMMILDVALG